MKTLIALGVLILALMVTGIMYLFFYTLERTRVKKKEVMENEKE